MIGKKFLHGAVILAALASTAALEAESAPAKPAKALGISGFPGSKFKEAMGRDCFARLQSAYGSFKEYSASPDKYSLYMPAPFADLVLGDKAKAEKALRKGFDLSGFYPVSCSKDSRKLMAADKSGESPARLYDALMLASLFGKADSARLLLAAGAEVNARHDRFHHTALECAILGNVASEELLRLLAGAGADRDSLGQALIAAAFVRREDYCKLLLELGADPDARNGNIADSRQSALLIASRNVDLGIARLLLDAGADPNLRSRHDGEFFQELAGLKYVGRENDSNDYFSSSISVGISSANASGSDVFERYSRGEMIRYSATSPLQALFGGSGQVHGGNQYFDLAKAGKKGSPAIGDLIPLAEALVRGGAKLDDPSFMVPPLSFAIEAGLNDAAVALIGWGASPATRDYDGRSTAWFLLDSVRHEMGYHGGCDLVGQGYVGLAQAMIGSFGTGLERGAFKDLLLAELKAFAEADRKNGDKYGELRIYVEAMK
jgi:hypothetical protein